MTETRTRCDHCGKPFPGSIATRSDKRYCNSTCRAAAYRSDRMQQARDIAQLLSADVVRWREDFDTPGRGNHVEGDTMLATAARAEMLTRRMQGIPEWQDKVDRVKARIGSDLARVWESTLVGCARPVPSDVSRWDVAILHARDAHVPMPITDAASAFLLGAKSPLALPSIQSALTASVHPRGAPPVPSAVAGRAGGAAAGVTMSSSSPVSMASPKHPVPFLHSGSECNVCDVGDVAARMGQTAVTASGVLDPGLKSLINSARKAHEPVRGG